MVKKKPGIAEERKAGLGGIRKKNRGEFPLEGEEKGDRKSEFT